MTQPEFKHFFRIKWISEADARELFSSGQIETADQRLAFEDCMIGGTGIIKDGQRIDPLDMYLPVPTAQERFDAVVDEIKAGMREAEARQLAQRSQSANAYMKARGIGESAVDLIPDDIQRPFENRGDWMFVKMKIQKELGVQFDGLYWTHTPGRMKWGVWMVRQAMAEIK